MAVSMIGPKFYAWNRDGKPLAFGKLYTYQARTNTPKATYQSEDQVIENTNPVILNGEGYANVYLDGSYKMVLKDDKDNEIWSSDPVTSNQASEWINCLNASYVSPTSFRVGGNVTDLYHPGRRVRLDSLSTSYSYSTIESSSYSNGFTTITIVDSIVTTGLSMVCASIIGVEAIAGNVVSTFDYMLGDSMALINSNVARVGGTYLVRERNEGFGGGSSWVGVDSGIDIPNGFNVVESNVVDGLAFKLIEGDEISALEFGVVPDGSTDNTDCIQFIIDYATQNRKLINLPSGTIESRPLTIYRGTMLQGKGKLSEGSNVGTTINFDLSDGEDGFSYGGGNWPGGEVKLLDLKISNKNQSSSSPQAILDAANRALWGTSDEAKDWNVENTWENPKSGGNNIPKLTISNVMFEKFAFAWDIHTWMSSIEDVEMRFCGISRTHGTSVNFNRVWPQYTLRCSFQLSLVYSNMSACSLIEQQVSGFSPNCLENHGGTISLYDCGWENSAPSCVYKVFTGTVKVYNEKFVTDKSIKAGTWGWLLSEDAKLMFYGVNKTLDADGDVTDPCWNWFRCEQSSWFDNIMFMEPMTEQNLPIRYPHASMSKNFAEPYYRGMWTAQTNPTFRDVIEFVPIDDRNYYRQVACMDLVYSNRFIVEGTGSTLRLDIHGPFDGADTTASRHKFGQLRVKIVPRSNINGNGSTIYQELMAGSEYTFSFDHDGTNLSTSQAMSGSGFDDAGDLSLSPIQAYYNTGLNDDGARVEIKLRAINSADNSDSEYTSYLSADVYVEYRGSCNDNTDGGHSGERLNFRVV